MRRKGIQFKSADAVNALLLMAQQRRHECETFYFFAIAALNSTDSEGVQFSSAQEHSWRSSGTATIDCILDLAVMKGDRCILSFGEALHLLLNDLLLSFKVFYGGGSVVFIPTARRQHCTRGRFY